MTLHAYDTAGAPAPVSPANPLPVSVFGATRTGMWRYAAASGGITNTTTAVTMRAAAGAGQRIYVTGLQINTQALGTATELAIRDGAGGTVLWRVFIPTAGIPFMSVQFDTPLMGTANTLLEVVTLTESVTGSVYVNAQGFTST